MCFGVCEGSENVFENQDTPVYTLFKDPTHYVAPEGAESFEELFARTGSFLKEVVEPALQEGCPDCRAWCDEFQYRLPDP